MKRTLSGPNARSMAAIRHGAAAVSVRLAAIVRAFRRVHLAVWGGRVAVDKAREWETVDRRLLVDRSPFAKIYDEDVQLTNGTIIKNFVRVELPDFVITFTVTREGLVPLVRQFRQGLGDYTLELPAGHIDTG